MEKEKEKVGFAKVLLTCSNCNHYPLTIDSMNYHEYGKEYSVITKCPNCHDLKFKKVPKEIFDKLDLKSLE